MKFHKMGSSVDLIYHTSYYKGCANDLKPLKMSAPKLCIFKILQHIPLRMNPLYFTQITRHQHHIAHQIATCLRN